MSLFDALSNMRTSSRNWALEAELQRTKMFNAMHIRRSKSRSEHLNEIALLSMSLLSTLIAKGVITREELLRTMEELDELDGQKDGKADMEILKKSLGYDKPKPAPLPPKAPKPHRYIRRSTSRD